ncbi:Activating signal cointegrator 1 complex subunit 2 [Desmophyllum pertusum]|uniref:Activating signal cointegrator 1 complex subunit 2 n=1 Tax=Desmophyllum pertusum TaxID=174260 RepID=A0A9X0CX77_9CNID|nr:Activating signal cointegrator 1 complex subunit 2 [Desmophyllum pertusum]
MSNKVDVTKVHKGKRRDRANLKTLLSDKSHITGSVKERYAAYDVFNRHAWTASLYDDEYDDTYDSQNVGAQDADSADELTVRRPFTIPRVLGGSPEPSDEEDEESEEDSSTTEESKAKTEEPEVDKSSYKSKTAWQRRTKERREGR